MKEERLFRVIGEVDADLVEEADLAAPAPSRPTLKLVLRWGAVAACLALVLGLGLSRLASTPGQPGLVEPEPAVLRGPDGGGITPYSDDGEITPFSAPMGVRKFLNYNGYRYAFLEDGAPFDSQVLELTDRLGILEQDILAGMAGPGENEAATLDLATTYALGGELWELSGYDPAYRLAVVWEGQTYLADLVGRVDNQPLDAADFVRVAELETRIRQVEILPHMGGEALATVEQGEAEVLVRLLARSQPTEMSGEDYLAVADAQSSGRSWQLALRLEDGTAVTLYLIPDLGLVSIGDSSYRLPESFGEEWGSHLNGLAQGPAPLH